MYAIVKTGGKQYRVTVGQELNVEKLAEETGKSVHFDQVLMVADGEDVKIGAPFIDKAKVTAEVLDHDRAKTIEILKFKRRKQHMKRQGHRQYFTKVKITDIKA